VFQTADAEALPFADASFDVALSTFGAMFTPQHARTAGEMLRVVRAGGRIGLANWTPEGFIGQLFKVIGAHLPSAGLRSPALWGTEPHLVELFGPQAASIRCERRKFNFRYNSAAHWLEVFRTLLRADAQGIRRAGRRRPGGRWRPTSPRFGPDEHRRCKSLVVPGEYLEVVIVKR
jgi:SAM-dependent methyltransferase